METEALAATQLSDDNLDTDIADAIQRASAKGFRSAVAKPSAVEDSQKPVRADPYVQCYHKVPVVIICLHKRHRFNTDPQCFQLEYAASDN